VSFLWREARNHANAIGIDPKTGERLGAADPRDQGSAAGY